MSALARVRAALNALRAPAPAAPQAARGGPPPVLFGPSPARVVADQIRKPGPLPAGRVSRAPSDAAFAWWLTPGEAGRQLRADAIRACREASTDGDVAGAKRDLIALANPGLTVEFEGSERARRQAERETAALIERWRFASLDELANNQLGEVYEAGAASLEFYLNAGRSHVAGVEVVPPEELVQARHGNETAWVQHPHGVVLDPRTFVYSPHATRSRDPYGTPVMLAALDELRRKAVLTLGIDKALALVASGPFIEIAVPRPSPVELGFESEEDPGYFEKIAEFYRDYADLATSAREKGVLVREASSKDTKVESKATPLTSNVSGMSDLEHMNNLKLWSALATLPFMRGKMDSTTQALAQIVYPILLAHAANMRGVVKPALEFGLNLNLRLLGVPARATLVFAEPPNPFVKDHAEAAASQAEADTAYVGLYGEEYLRWMAVRDGFNPEAVVAAHRERAARAPAPDANPNPNPDPQTGGEDDQ